MNIKIGEYQCHSYYLDEDSYIDIFKYISNKLPKVENITTLSIIEKIIFQHIVLEMPLEGLIMINGYSLISADYEKSLEGKIEKIKIDNLKAGYVYLIDSDEGVKIGISRCPKKRYKQINIQMPFVCRSIESFPVLNMRETESYLHNKYRKNHKNGEWFNLTYKQQEEIKDYLTLLGDDVMAKDGIN